MPIDFDKNTIIGCIPFAKLKTAPTDQSPCILEKCLICNKDMWVSEKKREFKATRPNVEIYCFICIVVEQMKQGIDPRQTKLLDMTRLN